MIRFPEQRPDGTLSLEEALGRRRSLREFSEQPITVGELGQLLWSAQGVTNAEGSRTAPSAGALYPLELYVIAGEVVGVDAGVYHYEAGRHSMTLVAAGDVRRALAEAAAEQDWLADAPVTLAVGAVEQRTARKYGDRASRYVAIEVGHVAQNISLQAVALGLGSTDVGAFEDDDVRDILRAPDKTAFLLLVPVGHSR